MLEVVLNVLIILFVFGTITVIANLADQMRRLRPLVFACIVGLNGLVVIFPLLVAVASVAPVESPTSTGVIIDAPPGSSGSDSAVTDETDELTTGDIIAAVAIALIGAAITTLFMWESVRRWAARFLPPPPAKQKNIMPEEIPMIAVIQEGEIERVELPDPAPVVDAETGFRPESMVHLWAGVLVVHFIAYQLMSYFLSGGLSGLAEDIGVTYGILIINFIPMVLIPLLGIGMFTRRRPRSLIARLDLKLPTPFSIGVATASAMGLLFVVIFISLVWQSMVSEETFKEQTEASNALAESINTVGLAFMVALTAGIGEEIAFRAALQPVYGFWFTAVAFVVAHSQYTLTPASLIILFVAVALGLIRRHFGTTTAIMTHFLYDFIPLVLPFIIREPAIIHILF